MISRGKVSLICSLQCFPSGHWLHLSGWWLLQLWGAYTSWNDQPTIINISITQRTFPWGYRMIIRNSWWIISISNQHTASGRHHGLWKLFLGRCGVLKWYDVSWQPVMKPMNRQAIIRMEIVSKDLPILSEPSCLPQGTPDSPFYLGKKSSGRNLATDERKAESPRLSFWWLTLARHIVFSCA